MSNFVGVKVALLFGDKLLVFLRDDKPGLRFAGMWDFPGGGRENNETPFECIVREVDEEFSIKMKPESILWQKAFPAMHDPKLTGYFMVARITQGDIDDIKFGSEGQKWTLMAVEEFLSRDDVVPHLKERLSTYLKEK